MYVPAESRDKYTNINKTVTFNNSKRISTEKIRETYRQNVIALIKHYFCAII